MSTIPAPRSGSGSPNDAAAPRGSEPGGAQVLVAGGARMAESLATLLSVEGFAVEVALDGEAALTLAEDGVADLVVLDEGLRQPPALEVCRRLQAPGRRILVVSGAPSEAACLAAFDAGADDYIGRPDRGRELVARVRTLLRRRREIGRGREVLEPALTVGDVTLDAEAHQVWVRGQAVGFTPKEFALLEMLLRNAGLVLSRSRLVGEVWGEHLTPNHKTLEVHVGRLRAKVEENPSHPRRLLTVRGLGYRYQP